jgi:hypothetical protein
VFKTARRMLAGSCSRSDRRLYWIDFGRDEQVEAGNRRELIIKRPIRLTNEADRHSHDCELCRSAMAGGFHIQKKIPIFTGCTIRLK